MVATPPEDIAKQHEEAQLLVEQNMAYAALTHHSEISLAWKQQPTDQESFEEKKDTDEFGTTCPPCVSSRGRVDVSKLAELVKEGYNGKLDPSSDKNTFVKSATNLWDSANAAKQNVSVVRPSHDAWGIKKIVLMFCDDFLQDVYEMPWWHARPDIREAIQPVLSTLNVQSGRVVRMLLAALPPGVTIPIHHDTGHWVKYTHRVHCPILMKDPTKVLFRCGLSSNDMIRVDCTSGHVFELNNQAKHAVSNCGDDHRVHLILDYVDEHFESLPANRPRKRIKLAPGERLLQTRRSIDRAVDKGKRPTPSFMILGAQKAGTTSIYEYMVQHPLVARPKRRETHCLDWRWNEQCTTTEERRNHCLQFYYAKELRRHPSCLTGDSTPSYLLDSLRVIPRIKEVFPWQMKFIVMLRNPVQRAHSHYAMVTSLDGTPEQIQTRGVEWHNKSFEEVVKQDLLRMQECGLIPYWNLSKGTVDQDSFDSFVGSSKESEAWNRYLQDIPMNTGSHSLVSRGMYELQLRPWFAAFPPEDFLVFKLDDLKNDGVQSTMNQVWKHLCLPEIKVKDDSAKNTRSYSAMDDGIAEYLERFYEPHNRRLSLLLGSKWNNVWSD